MSLVMSARVLKLHIYKQQRLPNDQRPIFHDVVTFNIIITKLH